MSQKTNFLKEFQQSTLRQWRSTPTYIFLTWRWGTWVFALISLLTTTPPVLPHIISTLQICLSVTFLYSLVVTLYAPVSRILLLGPTRPQKKPVVEKSRGRPRKSERPRQKSLRENPRILRPLLDTQNTYLNIAIYGLDVIICGLITYFSAVNQSTPFGASSPFYRYGLSAVLVAGFTYSYAGGLLATLGYSLFIIYGAFVYPPGQTIAYGLIHRPYDLVSSLIDAPLVALLAAYLANQLNKAIQSKQQLQDNVRREQALRGVSATLVTGINDQIQLLRSSARAIRQGGHFEKLVIALVQQKQGEEPRPDFDIYIETDISEAEQPDISEALVTLVAKTGQPYTSFEPPVQKPGRSRNGIARLYKPFFKENQIYLVIGAERTREAPFEPRQENFLAIIGPQLVVALENIRLTRETAELAAAAERSRIAREIHDGVAQLLYMLSLHSETGLALLERAAEGGEENRQALATASQHIEKLVTISKQALWETRHYMFMLRPMLSGDSTLTQMLTSQISEFATISGLSARLDVEGEEQEFDRQQARNHRLVQIGTAIFRITQEALTNAYKHADANQLHVLLRHQAECVTVEISDDGRGIPHPDNTSGKERIYSGHGLQGMTERASELDGTLTITENSTGGTRVIASIPLQARPGREQA